MVSKLAMAAIVMAVVLASVIFVVWRADDRLRGGSGGGPSDQVGVPWRDGLLSQDGTRLAVRVAGRPLGGDQPCGAWYIGLVADQIAGLRVTVITIPAAGAPSGQACAALRVDRCASVTLPFPPGNRPVFDGVSGTVPPLRTASSDGDLCAQLLGG